MFAALFANGGPPLVPQPASAPWEWVAWGGCMSAAVFLGGWGLLNRNRPARDTPVGVAVTLAFALVIGASALMVWRNHERRAEQNRLELERHAQEARAN